MIFGIAGYSNTERIAYVTRIVPNLRLYNGPFEQDGSKCLKYLVEPKGVEPSTS